MLPCPHNARGSLPEVLQEFGPGGRRTVKGEVVLLVSGCSSEEQQFLTLSAAAAAGTQSGAELPAGTADSREAMVRQLVSRELAAGRTVSATAKALSQQLQVPRSKVYKVALELAGQQEQQKQSESGQSG
jgi:16S rRNA C1402 (ribose-2'-O) methylase RsmI